MALSIAGHNSLSHTVTSRLSAGQKWPALFLFVAFLDDPRPLHKQHNPLRMIGNGPGIRRLRIGEVICAANQFVLATVRCLKHHAVGRIEHADVGVAEVLAHVLV